MEISSALSLPPGFGFHPTDTELISHYLKRKILGYKTEFDVIPEIDIYKYEPWDLPAKSLITTRDSKWHFFTSRDKKYPNGSRANRATAAGYWKSTGKDRNIRLNNRIIGTKKTLVFHQGRPPLGKRSEWIMHEFYLNEDQYNLQSAKETFVLCRVTKRNASTPEDEELLFPQEKDISQPLSFSKKNRAKEFEDLFLGMMPKKEIQSPSEEDLIDLDSWFAELSDPNPVPDLPLNQPINPIKTNGNLVSMTDSQETGFPLWEDFLEFNQSPLEVNYGLLFEDRSPVSIDSFDYHLGQGSFPIYDYGIWPSAPVSNSEDIREVHVPQDSRIKNPIRLDAHKATPGTIDETYFLDSDISGPSSTYEVRAHIVDKPIRGAMQGRSLGWFHRRQSSVTWVRAGRRARISRQCRDGLRRARGLVKSRISTFLGRSQAVDASLSYIFFLACMVASVVVAMINMAVDTLRFLYAYACL